MGDPEAAFVGEVTDGAGFGSEVAAKVIPSVDPTGQGEVGEDFGAVGEMHEGAAEVVFEVAVAELDESGVLVAIGPEAIFVAPSGAFLRGVVAVVGGEDERRAGGGESTERAQGGAALAAAGDLHKAVEHKEDGVEGFAGEEGVAVGAAGVGVEEGDGGGGAAFVEERLRLGEEFFGEVEGVEAAVALIPEGEGDTAGATTGFKQAGAPGAGAGKELGEDGGFAMPKAKLVGGAGVVDDGAQVVEIGADLVGGDARGHGA